MPDFAPFVCALFVNVIFAVISGVVAHNKGRNVVGWTLLGLLGWVPLVVVACLPNLNEQKARESYQAEENRRLREQLRQERIKSETFRQHAAARLDAHDQHLGLDTRSAGPMLGAPQTAGELGPANPLAAATPYDLSDPAAPTGPRWYYGRQGQTLGPVRASEIADLIRTQIITRETLLWSDEMADWTPAGDVATFAGQFS